MSPEPLTRVLVERSGTPNTLISTRSPIPSLTLELASKGEDEDVLRFAAAAGCCVAVLPALWPSTCTLHQPTRNTHKLRKTKLPSRLPMPRLLDFFECVEFNIRRSSNPRTTLFFTTSDTTCATAKIPKTVARRPPPVV